MLADRAANHNYPYNSIGALSNSVSGGYNLSYGYNILGQMTSYSFFSTTNYLYNASGLETAFATGGATTQFTWGNLGGLPQLLSDSKDYFIYGPGTTPVEQYNVTSSPPSYNPTFLTYFKPSDTWLVTNLGGQMTNAAEYDATGNLSNGSPGTIFGYQGQFQGTPDNSTGWVNMRARWYDTQSATFTSQDPALTTTFAPYQYANGDPVNNSDPSGTCTNGNISCTWDNGNWANAIADSGGPTGITDQQAVGFLVDNNFQANAAQETVASFAGGIQIGLLTDLSIPLYRYFGGERVARGFFDTDTHSYSCPQQAIDALNLHDSGNTATHVVQAAPNFEFPGQSLYLFGMVAGGNPPGAVQFMVYDPNELIRGDPVPTGQNPPALGFGAVPTIPLPPDDGGGD